jgi:flagellar assembly protein FliH
MTRIIRADPEGTRPPKRRPRPESTRVLRASQIQTIKEAEHLLRGARQEAKQILERAGVEAGQIKQRAVAQGNAAAARILVAARDSARRQVDDATRGLTQLAVKIAEKLLGQELSLRPERVVDIVRECLKKADQARRIVLRVNPDDLRRVEDALARLKRACEAEVLLVEPDAAIDRGGCIVETELSQLDGRLDSQLAAILAGLGQDS